MGNMQQDKRRSPRVRENLPIKITEGGENLVVESKNISSSGAYCITLKPVPLMSKVALTMLLPGPGNKKCRVDCGGTIVRILPVCVEGKNVFEAAIFFDNITDQARANIDRYVKSIMTDQTGQE